jgi:hypothetical protein
LYCSVVSSCISTFELARLVVVAELLHAFGGELDGLAVAADGDVKSFTSTFPGRGHINLMLVVCRQLTAADTSLAVTVVVREEWRELLDAARVPVALPAHVLLATIPTSSPRSVAAAPTTSALDCNAKNPTWASVTPHHGAADMAGSPCSEDADDGRRRPAKHDLVLVPVRVHPLRRELPEESPRRRAPGPRRLADLGVHRPEHRARWASPPYPGSLRDLPNSATSSGFHITRASSSMWTSNQAPRNRSCEGASRRGSGPVRSCGSGTGRRIRGRGRGWGGEGEGDDAMAGRGGAGEEFGAGKGDEWVPQNRGRRRDLYTEGIERGF